MLRVLDRYVPYDVPVLGINLGRLGFLPEVETADMDRALQYLLEEKYEIEHRMMLYYHVSNRRESIVGYATNEISVSRGLSQRMIAMDVKADGRFVEHYIADGALVASPTGSTAYSLSAGGPIISPDVDCLLVNPICPHALESRPIILSDHCQVELCLNMKEERKGMQFSADGCEDHEMFNGDRVSIQRSPHDALMIRLLGEKNFFNDADLQQSFYDLWEEFSKRYVKYQDRLVFELLNEVTDKDFLGEWNRISNEAVKVIRKYSKDIKIIIGSYWNNSLDAMKDLAPPADENIVYTFHCYDPLIFTHQGAYWVDEMPRDFRLAYPGKIADYTAKYNEIGLDKLCDFAHITVDEVGAKYFEERFDEAKRVAEERDVAVYCGEYGVINLADPQDTLRWYKDITSAFDKFGFGRAAWSYKEMDYGISDAHMDSVRDELLKLL